MGRPRPKKISQILPTFQNVAQTSHYLVKFGLPPGGLRDHLASKGVDHRFHGDTIGLLCSAASLPGSTFANEVVNGEFQGVNETIPHTRTFTRIKLEFYVDNEYKVIKFLEHWMEYITGASGADPLEDAYNFKLNYPEKYRSQSTTITKFERNYRQNLEYTFKGLYPLALDSVKVQYQKSNVLKASASFAYERYICGKASSLSKFRKTNENTTSAAAGKYGNRSNNLKANEKNAVPIPEEKSEIITNGSEVWSDGVFTLNEMYQVDFEQNPGDYYQFDIGPGPGS